MINDGITAESIEREFPGWEVFRVSTPRWHARIRGADKPVMVHDDDLEGLREEIGHKISEIAEAAYQERGQA